VGDVIRGMVLGAILSQVTWPWATTARWNFSTQVFIGN